MGDPTQSQKPGGRCWHGGTHRLQSEGEFGMKRLTLEEPLSCPPRS